MTEDELNLIAMNSEEKTQETESLSPKKSNFEKCIGVCPFFSEENRLKKCTHPRCSFFGFLNFDETKDGKFPIGCPLD